MEHALLRHSATAASTSTHVPLYAPEVNSAVSVSTVHTHIFPKHGYRKSKGVPVHDMKGYRGGTDAAPSILTLATRRTECSRSF